MKYEIGSFYPAMGLKIANEKWCDSASLAFTGSGRDALYAILCEIEGNSTRSIHRIWLPSYYCHSVTRTLQQHFKIFIYESRAGLASEISEELTENDVVILLEYFGHKASLHFYGTPRIILDKTHDPISSFNYNFNIEFVFGSLRKTLPVADGGFYFKSDGERTLKREWSVTKNHTYSFKAIEEAMSLKLNYIATGKGSKQDYLDLHALGEEKIGNNLTPSGMLTDTTSINYADIYYYLTLRQNNNKYLNSLINSINLPLSVIDSFLYFTVLLESESARDLLRKKLIEKNIYPAVLWPVDSKYMTSKDQSLSKRTLVLPTDFRYDESDMDYIAKVLSKMLG